MPEFFPPEKVTFTHAEGFDPTDRWIIQVNVSMPKYPSEGLVDKYASPTEALVRTQEHHFEGNIPYTVEVTYGGFEGLPTGTTLDQTVQIGG